MSGCIFLIGMNKTRPESGCLICSEDLVYLEEKAQMECAICNETKWADAQCQSGHFICDQCHSNNPDDWIEQQCCKSTATDPVQLAIELMRHPCVAMHGPEHHFLVPAVLVTAWYNLKNDFETKKQKLVEARKRAQTVVGGACGFHGACGAAIGVGIFTSIVLDANPLSVEGYRLANKATAEALARIAERGGPRCCKRNVFIALEYASGFSEEHLGQPMPVQKISCEFYPGNRECLKRKCDYYGKS